MMEQMFESASPHLQGDRMHTAAANPDPVIKRSPRLGALVILATCVPFWVAVAWMVTQ
jgi:hypothetical protein